MSDSSQPTGVFDLKREEVEDFYRRADSLMIRADELLSDYYRDKLKLGKKTIHKICELYANASALRNMLDRTFKIEEAPENAIFRIKSEHVTALMAFIMALMDTKASLIISNISLKEH